MASTLMTHWIRSQISSNLGIIVSEEIIMQPCFLVVVLTRKPQTICNGRGSINICFPKRRELRGPDHSPIDCS